MIMNLNKLLEGVQVLEHKGDSHAEVEQLVFDSRKVQPKSCFIAQKGTQQDGHEFIDSAIQSGASAIVCQKMPNKTSENVSYVVVRDSSETLGLMAANYFGNPSRKLKLIGVTGTNGKTTTVTLLHQLFSDLGHPTALISTVVNKIKQKEIQATHTTPDAIQLNALLAETLAGGCTHCFMEVSSHAISQKRVAGLHFSGAVFTNITHEHLDFHGTFANYLQAKKTLFDNLPKSSFALSNKDDKNGEVMLQETKAAKHFYALKTQADFKAKLIESSVEGISLKLEGHDFWSPLIGNFNAYNILAVYATARLLEQDSLSVLRILSKLQSVAGRFQHLKLNHRLAIVDYAHSPDALKNVLTTIQSICQAGQEIITVVGCGGDRDKTKRPIMAEIACRNSHRLILTSDNPRTEDPESIIDEMKKGVSGGDQHKVLSITNREEAIKTAVSISRENDIILVAGKGHETYQEIMGERKHFDDWEILKEALQSVKKIRT